MTLSTFVAIILTGVFLVVSGFLLFQFGTTADKDGWNHAVVVYNAITSVAFTAVGVLLGAKVQQVNVERATAAATLAKAQVINKDGAIQRALGHLDAIPNRNSDEAGGGISPVAAAKSILQLGLGSS